MAYRVFGNSSNNDNAIEDDVQETFVQAIKYLFWIYILISNQTAMCLIKMIFRDLKFLQERQKRKCEKLEQVCREKEALFSSQIQDLQKQNKVHLILIILIYLPISTTTMTLYRPIKTIAATTTYHCYLSLDSSTPFSVPSSSRILSTLSFQYYLGRPLGFFGLDFHSAICPIIFSDFHT